MTLSALTRDLYRIARASNKLRILGSVAKGRPAPAIKYARNRAILGAVGRFLR
jgi:hypothetical protein